MRIGLDATRIQLPTGEGTYVRQVVIHMSNKFPEDIFFVLVPEHCPELVAQNIVQIPFGPVDGLLGRLRYFLTVAKFIRPLNLDVFHNLSNYGFQRAPCPVVTTIHDLLSLRFPELRPSRIQGLLYRFVLPRLLGSAQSIVASSQSTVEDLRQFYHLDTPVELTYLGFDKTRFTPTPCQDHEILSRYGISPGYVLFVGFLTPKKNLDVIIRALARLNEQGQKLCLVLAGKQGHGTEALKQLIDKLGLRSQVKEIGFVREEDLSALYRQSAVFVFPSLYEGFGLPVLEALACGTAVLASNVSSLPEILGNPECLCPPHDEITWATKIWKLATDSAYRDAAVSCGRVQAAKFSWESCVTQIHQKYIELNQKPYLKS